MKSIFYLLGLLFVAPLCTTAFAQDHPASDNKASTTPIVDSPTQRVRQNIPNPIARLEIRGKSAVKIYYDTTNYIEVLYNPFEADPINDNTIVVNGMTLVINDKKGAIAYMLHLKKEDLLHVTQDPETMVIYDRSNNGLSDSIHMEWIMLRNKLNETQEEQHNADQEFNEAPVATDRTPSKTKRYSYTDRTSIDFLWGFTNWGDKWYSGLSKMDGAYNLRTTFSSYQLEMKYAFAMTEHWKVSVGIGYESDVYKFSTPLVDMDNFGGLYDRMSMYSNYTDYLNNNTSLIPSQLSDWSTKLVTRYVSLPLSLGYRFEKFRINITALPALAINTRHTGLKHEIDTRDVEFNDVVDVSRHIAPYKLDLRLDIRFGLFGIFLQVPTSGLFKRIDNSLDSVYPIKLGFVIL